VRRIFVFGKLGQIADRLVARFAPEVVADASQVCNPNCYARGACPIRGYEHCACVVYRDCSFDPYC
jgi:hypothetical protein